MVFFETKSQEQWAKFHFVDLVENINSYCFIIVYKAWAFDKAITAFA